MLEEVTVETGCGPVFGRRDGSGPPVLLLHGIPQTHLMWRLVAPEPAREFTVVVTDLRGYGASGAPASDPEHARYAMRELARDQVEVMKRLGYWVWSFLAAPAPVPERLIAGDPDAFVDHLLDAWADRPELVERDRRRRDLVRPAGDLADVGPRRPGRGGRRRALPRRGGARGDDAAARRLPPLVHRGGTAP